VKYSFVSPTLAWKQSYVPRLLANAIQFKHYRDVFNRAKFLQFFANVITQIICVNYS